MLGLGCDGYTAQTGAKCESTPRPFPLPLPGRDRPLGRLFDSPIILFVLFLLTVIAAVVILVIVLVKRGVRQHHQPQYGPPGSWQQGPPAPAWQNPGPQGGWPPQGPQGDSSTPGGRSGGTVAGITAVRIRVCPLNRLVIHPFGPLKCGCEF